MAGLKNGAVCLFPALLLFLFFPATPFSAGLPQAQGAASASLETVITNIAAEGMDYDSARQTLTFFGNVRVRRPDFTLRADTLRILLGAEGKSSPPPGADPLRVGELRRITAESNVRIALPDGRTGDCAKAVYDAATERITLEGRPVLREGASRIRGDTMIFYLRENRQETRGRVEVEFTDPGR